MDNRLQTPPGSPERVRMGFERLKDGMAKLFDDMQEYADTLPEDEHKKFWENMINRMG